MDKIKNIILDEKIQELISLLKEQTYYETNYDIKEISELAFYQGRRSLIFELEEITDNLRKNKKNLTEYNI